MSRDLGKLATLRHDQGVQPLGQFSVNGTSAGGDDNSVLEKALKDAEVTPSVWFVNFPDHAAPDSQKEALQKYTQSVEDYRCWASLSWWRDVYGHEDIPQDDSKTSREIRNAFCARVATVHMQNTPWLSMYQNDNITKTIECETTLLHGELIKSALEGFVTVTPGMIETLDPIVKSLGRTTGKSEDNPDNKTVICERIEYDSEFDEIKSFIRVISFSVTDGIKQVEDAKSGPGKASHIKFEIEFNHYEAVFDPEAWADASDFLGKEKKETMKKYVQVQSIECKP